MSKPTGNEVLPIGPADARVLEITHNITFEDLVNGIIDIYNVHVYCEEFSTAVSEKKFRKEAYKFIVKSFCGK